LKRIANNNPWHAPVYFLLLNSWARLVGWDTAALRELSLLIGVLTIAWTYRLGRDVISGRVGMYAAVLLGTSMLFVHYLAEVRMYTLIALVTVVTLWVYLRIVRSTREISWRWWLTLLVCVTALFYTHYLAAMLLIAMSLYHLIWVRKDGRWWGVTVIFILGAVLCLPWAGVLIDGIRRESANEVLHSVSLSSMEVLTRMMLFFGNGVALLPIAALALAGTARGKGVRTLWFHLIAIVVLVLLTNQLVHIIDSKRMRYLIAAWPLLSLVVAVGLLRLGRFYRLGPIVLALWVVLGVWNSLNGYITSLVDGYTYLFPMQHLAEGLQEETQPDDVVVNYVPDTGLPGDYYDGLASFYLSPLSLDYLTAQGEADGILEIAVTRPRVFIAYAPELRPAHLDTFLDALRQTHPDCGITVQREDLLVELFALPGLCRSD
jgi:mannosyltransferase